MLPYKLFNWADPKAHFGCPLFKSWLKACLVVTCFEQQSVTWVCLQITCGQNIENLKSDLGVFLFGITVLTWYYMAVSRKVVQCSIILHSIQSKHPQQCRKVAWIVAWMKFHHDERGNHGSWWTQNPQFLLLSCWEPWPSMKQQCANTTHDSFKYHRIHY